MFKLINKLKNRKGFTLIELIVVLAVLAIIMAIAVPKFVGVQNESRINADKATAEQIIKSARLQEISNNDGDIIVTGTAGTGEHQWNSSYMAFPSSSQSGGAFTLSGGGDNAYVVKFTPSGESEITVSEY